MADPQISFRTTGGDPIATFSFHDGSGGPLRPGEDSNIITFRIYNNYDLLPNIDDALDVYFGVSSSSTSFDAGNDIVRGDPPPVKTTQSGGGQGMFYYTRPDSYKAVGYNTSESQWYYWDYKVDGQGSDGDANGIIRGLDSGGNPFTSPAYVENKIYIEGPTVSASSTFTFYILLKYEQAI